MTKSLFIFGYGFSSEAIASSAKTDFATISGTTRNAEKAAALSASGIDGLVFDGASLNEDVTSALRNTTHLLISISPGEEDPVLSAMTQPISYLCPNLEWIGYLSTVGVYGNHDGEWVDEETQPRPVSKRSIQRVNAENAWTELAGENNIPVAVFRLSGIYGPGRNTFMNIQKGTARRLVKPGQVFNRIHREDIGNAVTLAMQKNIGGIFNITDNEPAPPQDVVTFAHKLMGTEPPAEIDFEAADLSPMARSFYGENKRVSNQKSKDLLGMDYLWPDYRSSLSRMWEEGSWR